VDTTLQFAELLLPCLGGAQPAMEPHRITERTATGRVKAKARGVSLADVLPLPLTSRPKPYNGLRLAIYSAPSSTCLG
jgi:hypothetical protein